MFNLAQLTDLHAGYKYTLHTNSQGINVREADGYTTLSRIVREVIESEVDAVVICGDVFHTPNPDVRTVIFVQNQLRRLANAGIPVYILSGNHDTNDIKSDISASRILHDPLRKIYSHAEPYVHYEIADGINIHLISHHMFEEQAETMSQVKPIEGEINILSTHGSVFDKYLHEFLHAEKSPREIVIPENLLNDNDWSYSLFGHIHERGWVGSSDKITDTANSKIYYNGSIIRRGFSDKEVPLGRGWTLWNIDEFGNFTAIPKQIIQRPQYDFAPLDAKDLSASEITNQIVERLQETQINGSEFDVKSAPIIRQKVINLSPAKHSSIDLKMIDKYTTHTLSWKLDPNILSDTKDSTPANSEIKVTDSTDVVKGYDEWVKEAEIIKSIEEKTTKEKVVKSAREYVKLGQEEALDSEE